MSDNSCPHGSENCSFLDVHELALTQKLLEAIGRFNQDAHIAPCPFCLRDTMLAVAATLHLEGVRTGAATQVAASAGDAFTQVACERFAAVLEAEASRITQGQH